MESMHVNGKRYFVCQYEKSCDVDEIAVNMMERNSIDGLMSFKNIRREEKMYFRYDTGEDESLEQWLSRAQYKQNVLKLLENLTHTADELNAYLMPQDHIHIGISAAVVRENKCRLAYIPIKTNECGTLLQLARIIIFSVKYAVDEDFTYIFDIQNAFGRGDIQNLPELKKWIKIVNKAEIPSDSYYKRVREKKGIEDIENEKGAVLKKTVNDATESAAGVASEKIFDVFGLDSGKTNVKDRRSSSIKPQKTQKKYGFFRKSADQSADIEEHKLLQEPADDKKDINCFDDDLTKINVMDEGILTLTSISGGNEYRLINESYIIGSGTQSDIVIQNNKTISRRHARIFRNNDVWYIEDFGSTNGTFVNGERLKKMEPCKLEINTQLSLSNEHYILRYR